MATLSLLFFLVPAGVVSAQTPEIQAQVETELWFHRFLRWLEAAVAPPVVLFLVLVAAGLLLYRAIGSRKSRRAATDEVGRERGEPPGHR
jgi:hypothetical protein